MTWVRTKIGDVITLQRGHDLPSSIRIPGDIPVISSSGITDYHNASKARGEGVVTGRYGTLGQVFYVNGRYWPLNTTLYVKDFKGNDPKFIYYFLQTLGLERFNGAAAVPGLDRNVIHRIDVQFNFHVPIQKKIASILSAYDELIENNTQRIGLLEEMAEEIYKEWFVRMRFPGHEQCRWYDKEGNEVEKGTDGGLPEGWTRQLLGKHLKYFRGKSYSSEELRDDNGIPMLNLKNINRGGGFRRDGIKYFEGKHSKVNEAHTGDIIMAVTDMTQSRDLVGRAALVPDMGFDKYIISMDLIRIEPISLPKKYFYAFLRFSGIGLELKEFANGANVLHLTPSILEFQLGLIPELSVCSKYEEFASPLFLEMDLLEKKNEVLQETRDLLLPRLISGKLSVEGLAEERPRLAMAAEPEMVYGK